MVSVESDPAWHRIVLQQLKDSDLRNVDLRLCPLEHSDSELWHRTYNPMPQYVAAATSFADASLDFCLVDGQYREACVAAAAPKLKPGGLLVLDNMNWRPLEHWAVPPEFRLISAGTNAKTQTGVFVRTLAASGLP
jgi:predicted O-methyltransferase YrrM